MNEDIIMSPIGVLMVEHRLIERMVDLLEKELEKMGPEKKPDPVFFDGVVEFAKTYTDECHHGKEESILFDKLSMKRLTPEHKRLVDELVMDHIQSRKIVNNLDVQRERYLKGEAGRRGGDRNHLQDAGGILSPPHRKRREDLLHPLHGVLQQARAGRNAEELLGIRQRSAPGQIPEVLRPVRTLATGRESH